MVKKTLIAAAIMAMGLSSAQAVMMDLNGGTPGGPVVNVTGLDWLPGNALSIGALSTPPLAVPGGGVGDQAVGERYFRTVAQGELNSFATTLGTAPVFSLGSYAFGREFTFEVSFWEFAAGIGTGSASFRLAPSPAGQNFFKIYADTSPDANEVTGTGFGAGAGSTVILEGTIESIITGAYTDNTRSSGTPVTLLDGQGAAYNANNPVKPAGDQQNGVLTNVGSGSTTIRILVTSHDANYFLDSPSVLDFVLKYTDTTNLTAPFVSNNPSDTVLGFTPAYSGAPGALVNGADCNPLTGGFSELGAPQGRCDYHFSTDANGAFIERVPEPHSVALIGLALGAMGWVSARRRKVR